jgi:hypothetical protein
MRGNIGENMELNEKYICPSLSSREQNGFLDELPKKSIQSSQ